MRNNQTSNYKILHFKSLTSTQDKAKEFAKKGLSDIVIIADTQTKARGRFKRKWDSRQGGLWMSILLKQKEIENIQYLTFAAAISVVKSIKKLTNIDTNIKWPNDVHYKRKKLCGILTEGVFGKNNFIIVGIGLNINQLTFPDEIKDIVTSLRIIRKKIFSKKFFSKSVLEEFFVLYNNYYNKNKLEKILGVWKRHCDTLNKDITVVTKTKILHGEAINIDKDCNLLLKLKSGKIVNIVEGDIKVRY